MYANYIHAIDIVEGGRHIRTLATAGLFSTYAVCFYVSLLITFLKLFCCWLCIELQLDYMTNISAFFSEFLTSAVLMCMVLAFGDSSNMPVPAGLSPLALFVLILGIGISLGMQTGTLHDLQIMNTTLDGKTGYAINPARDLGPRLMTAMVGYGSQVFTFRK